MIPVHAHNSVQIHRTTYINPLQTQIQYKLDDARKNTRLNTNTIKMSGTPKIYVHELRSRKTPKRVVNGGLVAAGPREVHHHLGRPSGVVGLKEEEGEEKGRVMVLVVVLVKVMELDFVGEGKRKVIEMMMKVMLEVEIEVMGVVIWW